MELVKVDEFRYEIKKEGKMKVPVRIFASDKLIEKMKLDKTLQQGVNVAHLPGIYKYSCIMSDGHQGYGFPIGGVAAFDYNEGGISPGGVGYDINCGVRLLTLQMKKEEVLKKIRELLESLYRKIPVGVGGSNIKVSEGDLKDILNNGARWAVNNGYGNEDDLKHCEEDGSFKQADANEVSDTAKKRGKNQVCTLGSGNHFVEVQYVDKIFNEKAAKKFGVKEEGQVAVMIHCGSRGLGHQTCSDYLREAEKTFPDLIHALPDRELVYAPAGSKVCERYQKAMFAAANFAFNNRHIIGHFVRESFKEVFGRGDLTTVYDICHNMAKVEEHEVEGRKVKVYVHRKGATRAFGPGRPEIPTDYRDVGQPIFIPGSMGTASYVLVGTEKSMQESFGSTAHGAGRLMSRNEAIRRYRGETVVKELESKGIFVRGASKSGIAEEAPEAYKDVDEVVRVSHGAGIGNLVVRLRPIGVTKG